MNNHKLDQDEIKEIAHFLTRRSITTSSGQPFASLTEYLETYNKLIDEMEKYNKTIN